jgi:galactosylceramidase
MPRLYVCTVAAAAAAAAMAPAAGTAAGAGAAATRYSVGAALGPTFDGVGAISGGGATSRFIPEYDAATRATILDFLFKPSFGMALQWLKCEIGGGALSTEGSEPSHWRDPGEPPVWNRGYEWLMMTEAKARNPGIGLYGLAWTWPGWVGDAAVRDPWANGTGAAAASYIATWVQGARDVYNLTIDVAGVWNERTFSPDYVKALRADLDARGLTRTAILCDDGRYECVPAVLADPALAAAVAIIGGHGTAPPSAVTTGKPVWFAEDFHSKGGDPGAGTWASQINRRFLDYNMTATLAWNAVSAFYSGLSFDNSGLMAANSPWSGHYDVLGTVWATAHTTQATARGWTYLATGAGGGSGFLSAGGSYVGYTHPPTGDVTLVVEKFSNDGDPHIAPETAQFCLAPALLAAAARATGASPPALNVWRSTFAIAPGETDDWFVQQPAVTPDGNGCFSLTLPVDSLWTVTTVSTLAKGTAPTPPPAAPFPLPWADGFNGCAPPAAPRLWADLSGTFECAPDGAAPGNIVMRASEPAKPISWEFDWRPHSVLGSDAWRDVNFTVAVRLAAPTDEPLIGVRCNLGNQSDYAALMAEISMPGLWLSLNASGGWAVWPSIAAAGNFSAGAPPVAQGVLPGGAGLPPGTWHSVSLVAAAGELSGWVDGAPAFTGVDVSQSPVGWTGWVGLGTVGWGQAGGGGGWWGGGQAVDFDDVVVSGP